MTIQLFAPKFDQDACLDQIRECLQVGWTGIGFKTEEFEQSWKDYTGYRHAFFVNSCTAALYLAVKCLKSKYSWNDGDEVITTGNTFVSTNHMILKNKLQPVFADIDDTFCLDPKSVLSHITSSTRAVMYVGMGGNPGHWKQIVQICKNHDLRLIVDAAHMSGTYVDGCIVGQQADVVCNSFQAVKNLPTADAGMVCFSDDSCDHEARKLAWLGIDKDTYARHSADGSYQWQYSVDQLGDKLHGNSVMAAIALAQFPHLEEGNKRRRQIASLYDQIFQEELRPEQLRLPLIPDDCVPSRHLYQVLLSNRDVVHDKLASQGIETGVHYISNMRYPMYTYARGTCPMTEYVSDHVLSLPMHLRLSDDDVRFIAHSVIQAIA